MPKAPRGVVLVEQVIAAARAEARGALQGQPAPVPAETLATLTFAGGQPLPPSLRRWLAFDAGYLGFFDRIAKPAFQPQTFTELVIAEFPGAEEYADTLWAPFQKILPGDCYLVPGGADSRRFLYVGTPADDGEYPVFVFDNDDVPYVAIEAPGLDVYLADQFGLPSHAHGAAIADQARRNFHGFRSFGLDGVVLLDGTEILPSDDGTIVTTPPAPKQAEKKQPAATPKPKAKWKAKQPAVKAKPKKPAAKPKPAKPKKKR